MEPAGKEPEWIDDEETERLKALHLEMSIPDYRERKRHLEWEIELVQ